MRSFNEEQDPPPEFNVRNDPIEVDDDDEEEEANEDEDGGSGGGFCMHDGIDFNYVL